MTFTLPQGSYHFRADFDNVQFWSNTQNDCTLPGCTAGIVTLPGGTDETAVDYSNGDYYHYNYDAVGNRLQQQTSVNGLQSTINYQYDIANRLAGVDNVNYSWDANGNLLNDGTNDYTYDPGNAIQFFQAPEGFHWPGRCDCVHIR